jgi:hypothetical protein
LDGVDSRGDVPLGLGDWEIGEWGLAGRDWVVGEGRVLGLGGGAPGSISRFRGIETGFGGIRIDFPGIETGFPGFVPFRQSACFQ